jgi:hypothetical protein
MRHAAIRVPFGSPMVRRDQWDTYWGPKKIIFLIRDIDDPAMTGASVESCQFVVLRSPWGRLGSIVYTCKRLRRVSGRFPLEIHLPKMHLTSQMSIAQNAKVLDPELSGEPQAPPYATYATTRPQTYPGGSPRADLHPKKVNNLGPMAPVPDKNVNYPRPPSSRRSGLVGPHTTPAIVNYKYMASTPREEYFGPTTLGT